MNMLRYVWGLLLAASLILSPLANAQSISGGSGGGSVGAAQLKAYEPLAKMRMADAGDSIAGTEFNGGADSGLFWALFRDAWVDLDIDSRAYADGGLQFAVGGSTTAQMVSIQLPQILASRAAGKGPDILLINSGTNNSLGDAASISAAVADITKVIDDTMAAGVRIVVVRSIAPRASPALNANQSKAYFELNTRLREVCRSRQNVHWFDLTPALLDKSSALFYPQGNGGIFDSTPRPAGSVVVDGLHPSILWGRLTAPFWVPLLKQIAPPRFPRFGAQSDVQDSTYSPRGNFLGAPGAMIGTGGTVNGVTNAGLAAGWQLNFGNGVVVTPSKGTNTDGSSYQDLTFSGTATAQASVEFRWNQGYIGDWMSLVGSPDMDAELLVRVINPVNIASVSLGVGLNGNGSTQGSLVGNGFGSPAVGGAGEVPRADIFPTVDETYFIRGRVTGHSQGANYPQGLTFTAYFTVPTGVSPGGVIRILGAGFWPRSAM